MIIPDLHVAVVSFFNGLVQSKAKQWRSRLLGLHLGDIPHLHSPSTHLLEILVWHFFPAHETNNSFKNRCNVIIMSLMCLYIGWKFFSTNYVQSIYRCLYHTLYKSMHKSCSKFLESTGNASMWFLDNLLHPGKHNLGMSFDICFWRMEISHKHPYLFYRILVHHCSS